MSPRSSPRCLSVFHSQILSDCAADGDSSLLQKWAFLIYHRSTTCSRLRGASVWLKTWYHQHQYCCLRQTTMMPLLSLLWAVSAAPLSDLVCRFSCCNRETSAIVSCIPTRRVGSLRRTVSFFPQWTWFPVDCWCHLGRARVQLRSDLQHCQP